MTQVIVVVVPAVCLMASGCANRADDAMQGLTPLIGVFLGAAVAICAEPLRQWWSRAKLVVSFEPEQGPSTGCVYWPRDPLKTVGQAIWIRVRVRNEPSRWKWNRLARSCRPFLTRIERRRPDGEFEAVHEDALPLEWAFLPSIEEKRQDIPRETTFYADVLEISANSQFLEGPRSKHNWEEVLRDCAEYRFTVVVGGDNVRPVRIQFRIKWTQQWDHFEAGPGDPNSPLQIVQWSGSDGTPNA